MVSGTRSRHGIRQVCGGDVMHRYDDTPEVIEHRLDLYEQQTAPLIESTTKSRPAGGHRRSRHADGGSSPSARRGRRRRS